ncbi:MAG: hypothetical protein KAU62_17930 [Candidatus Heimdallarchaeota archaeon]|nr:hypothetical protein [Candidatus Heimdallarchaeota archaeon]MCK4613041.1 hypothetical protein [Candidatus Heimdallarchaeota archaeon]
MSNIGRIYRAGKYTKKAADKAAIENHIRKFPQLEFNLDDSGEILNQINLKDPSNQALLVEEWSQQPLVYTSYNEETLQRMRWVDMGLFQMSLLPILKEYTGSGVPIQIIIKGKESINRDLGLALFSQLNSDTLVPDEKTLIGNGMVSANNLTVFTGTISKGMLNNKENKFLLVFFANEQIIEQRIFVKFNYKNVKIDNYDELKDSKFLSLAEQKNIHPNIVKKLIHLLVFNVMKSSISSGIKYTLGSSIALIVCIGLPILIDPSSVLHSTGTFVVFGMVGFFALLLLGYGTLQLRNIKKAKKLKLIPNNAKVLDVIDYRDPQWIHDFCQISDFWYLNEEASDIFLAAEMN